MPAPSHAFIDGSGCIQCVFPDGYDAESLISLPTDFFDRGWYKWNDGFVDDLEAWRAYVVDKANRRRDDKLYGGCSTSKGWVDTDVNSRTLLYSIKLDSMIDTNPDYSVNITLKTNENVTCTRADIDAIISSLREHDQEAHSECLATKQTALESDVVIPGLI